MVKHQREGVLAELDHECCAAKKLLGDLPKCKGQMMGVATMY
jgi:hypothetical protein